MIGAVESLIRSYNRKAIKTACDHHKRSYSFSAWETIIIFEIKYLVNLRWLFPNAAEDLDEEPFSGNTSIFLCLY